MDLTVAKVDRRWVQVPFRDIPAKNMVRELPHWTLFEICSVELGCGVTGYGETMCYYTWGTVSDDAVARVTGGNAAEHMWDDSLGAGLQMALFDAVGKACDVPCWGLLGTKQRDYAFVSWWDIDMSGEDWLAECRLAVESGYTSFKTKARPWFDLCDQLDVLTPSLPAWFDLDLDFNGLLVNSTHAARVLPEAATRGNVAIYESPVPQADVEGMKRVRQITNVPIAMHYGSPDIGVCLRENLCDGFVVGGGATKVTQTGATIHENRKVFWLQLVGTGMTAVWACHLAAVLPGARWPAVNCHQLYRDALARPVMEVKNGMTKIPDAPGLGVEPDPEALEQFAVQPKDKPYPAPQLLIAIRWPSGASSYYAHTQQYWDDFAAGRLPVFPAGVYLEQVPDDGSHEWRKLQARAADGGVQVGP